MRLLFLVQKSAWFIEHRQAWYRMSDMRDISLALSGLALKMINLHDLVELPHQAGFASVSQLNKKNLAISLRSPDKHLIDRQVVSLDKNVLVHVDWNTRLFADGWLGSDVTLTLDNVGSLHLNAYLPASEGSDGKTLTVVNTLTGNSAEIWIARDRKSRLPIVEHGREGQINLRLTCAPEKMDHRTDSRQLGFVMIEQEAWPV